MWSNCDIYTQCTSHILGFYHNVINDAIVIQMLTDDIGVLHEQQITTEFLVTGFPVLIFIGLAPVFKDY